MDEDNTGQPVKEAGSSVTKNVKGAFKTYGMSTMLLWIGAGLMIIGSFLDWASVAGFSIGGMDADGEWTLIMGIVIAAVGALPFLKQIKMKLSADISYWVVMAASLIAVYKLGSGAGDVRDFGGLGDLGGLLGTSGGSSVGIGIWVAMIGGLIAVLAAGMMKYKMSVSSMGDVKGLSGNQKKLLFVPALVYLAIFFFFYL